METGSFGFTWRERSTRPALVTAWHARRWLRDACLKWKYPVWVVDYSFSELEQVRVASATRPWRPRVARTLHLYPPETVYWEDYPPRVRAPSDCAYILFLGGDAAGFPALVHPRARYGRFLDPDGSAGALMMDIARTGHEEGEAGFWKAQAHFCALVDRLHRSEPVADETRRIRTSLPPPASSSLVQSVNGYMTEHLAEGISLAALARHLHVSVSTLSHRYRAESGITPMEHLLRLRVNLAKASIVKGQALKAVAESTGFSDASHLSRTFKHLEGVSPRDYLQRLRQADRGGAFTRR